MMRFYETCDVDGAFADQGWQRPRLCGPNSGSCVEVNLGNRGLVGVRDSKNPDSPVLVFDDEEWQRFLEAANAGQFQRNHRE
ncbi:DUF397 domain-containing protein [Amycolatopsis alba]